MKLQFEENEYYLMKDGEDLAIATTDESFIKELGAERLSVENCDAIYCEAINYGYDLDEIEIEIEMDFYLDQLWCNPIPLTEEWLLKFGFEKTLNQYKKLTLSNKIGCDNIPFIILFLDNQYQYDDLRFRTNIEYVHQLQNLFFALTGEELTIKD